MRLITWLEETFESINKLGEVESLTVMIMIGGGIFMAAIFTYAYLEKAIKPVEHHINKLARQHVCDPNSPVYTVHTLRFGKPRSINPM